MIVSTSLLVLALLGFSSAQYNPTLVITCSADTAASPVYTVQITAAGSTTGVIFIDGQCDAQTTAATGTYVFDTGSCATVPAFGASFTLVLQEFTTINLDTDKIVDVQCDPGTSTSATATVSSTGSLVTTNSETPSLLPPFTVQIKDATTSAVVTAGNVGTLVKIVVQIHDDYKTIFGYTITALAVELTATGSASSVTLISSGCSDYPGIFGHPAVGPTDGSELELPFTLFILNVGSPRTVPTTATGLTFTFTIALCDATATGCPTAQTCAKRKRRSESPLNTTDVVEVQTAFVVYPKGHHISDSSTASEELNADDICLSRTPFFALLFSLVVVLLVCMLVTVWMFCRSRRPVKDDGNLCIQRENAGFRAK